MCALEDEDKGGGGGLPNVTGTGFDEHRSFLACHWSMLIFVTAKQTDGQTGSLLVSYICVCV
jgi:hypothetical protein